jgi:hypothetical protein
MPVLEYVPRKLINFFDGDGRFMVPLDAALITSDFHDPLSRELAAHQGVGTK